MDPSPTFSDYKGIMKEAAKQYNIKTIDISDEFGKPTGYENGELFLMGPIQMTMGIRNSSDFWARNQNGKHIKKLR